MNPAKKRILYVTLIIFLGVFVLQPLLSQERADALQLYRQGRYERAVEVCLEEIEAMPRNMDSYTVLGWSLIALGRYDDAVEYGTNALEISRYDHRLIEIMGEAHYYRGENEKALSYFEEYVVLVPEGSRIAEVYYFMGEIYIRLEEYHHADIALSTAVHHYSRSAKWWSRLGFAREQAGDYSFSMEAYDQALSLESGLMEAQEGRARVRAQLTSG
ncbi:MAG: tetratricopeptide repeat protein [Spirochaetales bacterium]|nr:tetratricopeptide repeat protein [Spirochaetales bacterium]MCF7937104.1 tetratricopeptide repeat protein [Spirochaetales bacterium]